MVENTAFNKHNGISWPMLVDYSKSDCRRILRRHELEAYAKVVTAFRAQGLLTGEKRKLLEDLRRLLSIACDRHKAEVRRAINDEELATISKFICGKDTDENWVIEGRRVAPILLRGIPQTAFTPEADAIAKKWVSYNSKLIPPSETAVLHTQFNRDFEKPCVSQYGDAIQNHDETHSKEDGIGEMKLASTLPENTVEEEEDVVSTMVPEAAVEITCEAEVSKSDSIAFVAEEKTSLITELPVEQTVHHGQSASYRIPSTSVPPIIDDNQHNTHTIPPKSVIHAYVSGIKSALSATDSIQVNNFTPELARKASQSGTTVDKATNGIVPVISTRNFVIRQNNAPTTPGSHHSSQNVQISKIHSIGPGISVSGLSRIAPVTVTSTTTGLTTVVVTGTTGATAYVSPPVNSSRIVKNYSSVFGYHQSGLPTAQLSASTILADNKKQQQQSLQQHSILVQQNQQQQPQTTSSTPGNVIVVHRGPMSRLVTATPAVTGAPHAGATTNLPLNSPTPMPLVSASNRSLRILPVNNPLVTSATPAVATAVSNSSFAPILSASQIPNYNHQQIHQPNYRLSNPTNIICNDSELSSGGSLNMVKMPISGSGAYIAGGLLSRSTVASTTNMVSNSLSSSQLNSPALVSVLEPKRPRLAFVPASASSSARQ